MSIKISELTPKGANLQNSDLLEISESTADGYSSKSITGAEIITAAQEGMQSTLVSGTNIKTVNGNSLLGSGNLVIGGGGLTIGTTAITSGTIGRILFEGTGNVVQESSQLSWNNTTNALTLTTGKTFSAYQSGTVLNDALKITASNDGAVFGVQNSNSSGFSGIEYLSNTGVARVFTGFNNGNGQEFRFNNVATGGYIDFLISTSALRIANTRNILIGTTTDAGFKLDVNGTARVSGAITLTDSSAGLVGSAQGVVIGSAYWTDFTYGGTRTHRLALNVYGLNSYIGNNIAFGYNPTGSTPASAKIEIGAGTATAGTAPLKLRAGTNLTTPENGAFEFDGTNLYFTTGGIRKTINLI